ncbi:hypothetical protein DdX_17048 [Ditylenchus destructor]|uniref:Uncharacterized protein n=1 Tax=Ditylenchus destructor TaxID=166010 RepID=A0AAD4MSJ1_9BILA|nr:hypothetical protein DdX_17048 [Ditylenchus destructor]
MLFVGRFGAIVRHTEKIIAKAERRESLCLPGYFPLPHRCSLVKSRKDPCRELKIRLGRGCVSGRPGQEVRQQGPFGGARGALVEAAPAAHNEDSNGSGPTGSRPNVPRTYSGRIASATSFLQMAIIGKNEEDERMRMRFRQKLFLPTPQP